MDITEKLTLGLEVTALGLIVVFVCLALIIFLTMLLTYFAREKKKAVETSLKEEIIIIEEEYGNDEELVAVLSAAVAAYMSNENEDYNDGSYRIKSFKRINNKTAWGNAGKQSQIFNKF